MAVPYQVEGHCVRCDRPILSGSWHKVGIRLPSSEMLSDDLATEITLAELEDADFIGNRCPDCQQPTFDGLVPIAKEFVPWQDRQYGPGTLERSASSN